MEFVIHDAQGDWYQNKGRFAFVDPISGARFEPGALTKAKTTTWVEGQPVLVKYDGDPTKPEPEPKVEPKAEKSKA